ncbi:hypothetical protein GCM10022276_10400 [Sphingomonas limnosediminicola]|uniref:Uncharacterized protein n=1 Tax=Sphingomonas limnosediminicola TaxID=940133 RepID=A0ABP7L1B6_9SPHN
MKLRLQHARNNETRYNEEYVDSYKAARKLRDAVMKGHNEYYGDSPQALYIGPKRKPGRGLQRSRTRWSHSPSQETRESRDWDNKSVPASSWQMARC